MTRNRRLGRHGGIAPLTCVLLVAMLAMVAFAVDISWIALSQAELQNSADAAALAGANKLADNYVLYTMPTQTTTNKATLRSGAVTAAKTAARDYASYNTAGGATLVLLESDIDVGFTDSSGTFTSYTADSSKYPNTVKVAMRRDNGANTSLILFFAPVLGVSTMDLRAEATATLYTATVTGFKSGSVNSGMLPLTFDVNDWNNFIATGKDKLGTKSTDASGNPILQIWASINDTGNFGLLSLDDASGSASTIRDWINNGASPQDIKALEDNNLIPVDKVTNSWDWKGSTGFKSSDAMDLNDKVGSTFMLPLFQPKVNTNGNYEAGVGNGTDYQYNIVAFVGIKIMRHPTNPQENREVWVQPTIVSDPNAILSNPTVADGSTFATSFTVKLTR